MARLTAAAPWATAFVLVFTAYSFFVPPAGPNELSRYDLLLALARDTIDKASAGGHYYTDKAIGTSLLGLPWWLLSDQIYRFGQYGEVRADFQLWTATVGAVSLPSALLVLLVYCVARTLSGSLGRALLTAGAFGFATIAFPFATMFYGHQPAAIFGFAAFAAAFYWRRQAHSSPWLLGLAGFLAGWAAITEYPAAIIGAVAAVYILSFSEGRKSWWAYALGGLVGLLPLGIYNMVAFGAPWRLGYGFVGDSAFAAMGMGIMGVTTPKLSALLDITMGRTGLFSRSPFLLLALAGFVFWWRRGQFRREALLCLAISIGFLLYNAGYYLPLGGYGVGPRFLVPSLPFLVLGLALLPWRGWWLACALVLVSTGMMLMTMAALQTAHPGDPKMEEAASALMLITGGRLPLSDHPDMSAIMGRWSTHFGFGQVTVTWGTLRYGLEGAASLAPLALVAGVGLLAWLLSSRRTPGRGAARSGVLALAALAYGAVSLPGAGVPPLFAPPALEAQLTAGRAHPLSMVFDDRIELLAYSADKEVLRPGDRLALTLYWRARVHIDESETVFVHLLDSDNATLGGWDGVPQMGTYPTQMWEPGRITAETYRVPLSTEVATPTLVRVEVGMYRSADSQRQPAATLEGIKLGSSPMITRLAVPGPTPDLRGATALSTELGGQVMLVGYRLDGSDPDKVRGRLYWQAVGQRPARDYTVFVQALRDGKLAAQWDAQPLGGRYPTSLWSPSEIVEVPFELPLSTEGRAGASLIVGMYDLETMERLPVGEKTFVELPWP
ncbi:MAG: hypothetical protein M1380_01690 [Chloroflexi bacterium]|nr:hypothetical protein [Chloroflexota bacterium]MCL5025113.1 hypothetical protein [Chloroflexota bacterium]